MCALHAQGRKLDVAAVLKRIDELGLTRPYNHNRDDKRRNTKSTNRDDKDQNLHQNRNLESECIPNDKSLADRVRSRLIEQNIQFEYNEKDDASKNEIRDDIDHIDHDGSALRTAWQNRHILKKRNEKEQQESNPQSPSTHPAYQEQQQQQHYHHDLSLTPSPPPIVTTATTLSKRSHQNEGVLSIIERIKQNRLKILYGDSESSEGMLSISSNSYSSDNSSRLSDFIVNDDDDQVEYFSSDKENNISSPSTTSTCNSSSSCFTSPPPTTTTSAASPATSAPTSSAATSAPATSAPATSASVAATTPLFKTPKRVIEKPKRPFSTTVKNTPKSVALSARNRTQFSTRLFNEFNFHIFNSQLPSDLAVNWSNRLNKTAGRCTFTPISIGRRTALIELSTKVVDSVAKLRQTLCHEMCHAASWIIDHMEKPPHGYHFKKWASKASRIYKDIEVTTCHSFEINYKFRWKCSNRSCQNTFGRHSNSIDLKSHVCGRCNSKLISLGRFNKDGTPAKPRQKSAFAAFVQNQYKISTKSLNLRIKQLPTEKL